MGRLGYNNSNIPYCTNILKLEEIAEGMENGEWRIKFLCTLSILKGDDS